MTDYKKWGKYPTDLDHLYQIPGTGIKVSRLDLLRTAEMLEAERELGTREAAKLFQPSSGGEFTWGLSGEGDVKLPMYNGRYVDIDWLNTLVRFGVTDYAGYAAAKLGWTAIDGFRRLFSGGGLSGFKGHWNAYFSAEEQNAVEMARAIIVGGAKLRGVLHPELVRMAEDYLRQYRQEKARPPQQPDVSASKPLNVILAPKHPTQARFFRQQPPRSTTPQPGSLRWMAQGLR